MGYLQHDAVIVVFDRGHPRYAETERRLMDWRANIAIEYEDDVDAYRALIIGPVLAVANNYVTWAFLPDGSKEGWEPSDVCDQLRDEFKDIVDYNGEGVHVTFGEDHRREYGDTLADWQGQP